MNSSPENQAGPEQGSAKASIRQRVADFFAHLFHRTTKKLNIDPVELRQDIEAAIPVVKDRAAQATELLQTKFSKVVPLQGDTPETRYFKLLGLTFVGLMGIAVLAGVAALLLTLRNPEAVAVPRVIGMELPEAMDALQEFGLVAQLEQRYFPDPNSKGKIMEQNPPPAAAVRVGRDVLIVLSKGSIEDSINNYVGSNLEQVKEKLADLFGTDQPVLSVGEVSYVFDPADAGTIISQDPPPGTKLGKPIKLNLLVSRGKDATVKEAPAVLGLPWQAAVRQLIGAELPFVCEILDSGAEASPGTVLAQDPGAGMPVGAGQRLKLSLAAPDDVGAAQSFGIYNGSLPEYAVPVEVTVSVTGASGQSRVLWQFNHPGGALSFPYQVDNGSELVVSVFGKEFDRKVIAQP